VVVPSLICDQRAGAAWRDALVVRLLAAEMGLSNTKVADMWREYGLAPWRL
jgi:hypothetical protein